MTRFFFLVIRRPPRSTLFPSTTLFRSLNSQGTLLLLQPLALSRPGAAHTNSGTIDASAVNWTFTQNGTTPSFTSTGTVRIGSGPTWTISGGALNLNTGSAVGGAGTLALTGGTANLAASLDRKSGV